MDQLFNAIRAELAKVDLKEISKRLSAEMTPGGIVLSIDKTSVMVLGKEKSGY